MAYTLIGGTAIGTVLILVFLPALYALWFRVNPAAARERGAVQPTGHQTDSRASLGRPATHHAVDWIAPAVQAAGLAARLAPEAPR